MVMNCKCSVYPNVPLRPDQGGGTIRVILTTLTKVYDPYRKGKRGRGKKNLNAHPVF